MKKRGLATIVLVSLMLFSVFAVAPVSAELVCPPGIVSYWKFDEGSGTIAYDSVNGNHGLIHGATWTTGIVDGALSFDGVDDYIEVADSPSLDITDAITLEAWIKPEEYTYIGCVISKGKAYHLGLNSDSYINHVRFELQTSETSSIYTSSEGTVNLNEWNHIAVTVNNTALTLYINGTKDKEIPGESVFGISDYNTGIGASVYHGVDAFFNGVIDEVAIYNRTLSPEEIQQRYEVKPKEDLIPATDTDGDGVPDVWDMDNSTPTGYWVNPHGIGRMWGDMNGDGKLTSVDALMILQAAVGKISL